MGGPTGHGQRNKAHKAGRAAGLSARQKQRQGKEAGTSAAQRQPAKSGVQGGKIERLVAAKQHRDAKRQELLDQRRKAIAPIVVAILPLSEDVDVAQLWNTLLSSQMLPGDEEPAADPQQQDEAMDLDKAGTSSSSAAAAHSPVALTTISIPGKGRGVRLTLLPPPSNRKDLMAVVDIGRAAEVILLAVPGGEQQEGVDEDGKAALAVLRALGLPGLVVAVQRCGEGGAAGSGMKERSAAKKRAEKAICAEIAGDHKVFHLDTRPDCQQLMRYLADNSVSAPLWRQQRPGLLVEAARFEAAPQEEAGASSSSSPSKGTLVLTGYVRTAGLSANQLLHIPGAGDFQIDRIEGLPAPGGAGRGHGAMDSSGAEAVLVAQHDPEERESLTRENQADPLEGEQTWPSEQELLDVEQLVKGKARKRTLPAGTSAYQAAWILDDEEEEEDDEDDEGDAAMAAGSVGDEAPELADMLDEDEDEEGQGTEGTVMDEDDEDKAAALHEELRSKHRRKQEQEAEQQENPDEVDIPVGVQASTRFQKYRGLKSFRSSPWDAKEWLPEEYSKIFAFENSRRAQKRAKAAMERCTAGLDPCAVLPGSLVSVHVVDVPADVAALLLQRVQLSTSEQAPSASASASASPPAVGCGAPLVAFGLLQHEAKLSVLHLAVKKVNSYEAPLASKEQLLLVTGVRTFTARPIFSADTPGDKHKMERFLHPGRNAMASVYAPISHTPLPILAFKLPEQQEEGQQQYAGAVLAAAGSVRGCEPDRVILKKITLTGYPVRVHKKKATIRFMFHNPDDIRWFKPVELYTKGGRRGRITEPIGTHGAMKCQFDGPVQQRDVVCMSLYKRAFPKWPSSLAFS